LLLFTPYYCTLTPFIYQYYLLHASFSCSCILNFHACVHSMHPRAEIIKIYTAQYFYNS